MREDREVLRWGEGSCSSSSARWQRASRGVLLERLLSASRADVAWDIEIGYAAFCLYSDV